MRFQLRFQPHIENIPCPKCHISKDLCQIRSGWSRGGAPIIFRPNWGLVCYTAFLVSSRNAPSTRGALRDDTKSACEVD